MTSPFVDPIGQAGAIVKGAQVAAGWLGAGAQEITGLIPGADAANAAIDGIAATRRWLSDRHNWTRVAWTVGGAMLMYYGMLLLAAPKVTGVVEKVSNIVPAGKVANATKAVVK